MVKQNKTFQYSLKIVKKVHDALKIILVYTSMYSYVSTFSIYCITVY